jgi:hypothetical protein
VSPTFALYNANSKETEADQITFRYVDKAAHDDKPIHQKTGYHPNL